MDEDFDFKNPENELEDNFIELANCGEGTIIEEEDIDEADLNSLFSSDDDGKYEMDDELTSLKGKRMEEGDSQFSDQEEENGTRFTNYSMSSSVIRRNKQLMLVDDRFEKVNFWSIFKNSSKHWFIFHFSS